MPILWAALLLARPVIAPDLADFARCLTRAGATYYTADWCPHCAHQNEMFGAALRYIRTVDCTDGCNGVHSFPTWTFRDGSRISGVASFDELARRTGCRIGGGRDDARDELQRSSLDAHPPSTTSAARERRPSPSSVARSTPFVAPSPARRG